MVVRGKEVKAAVKKADGLLGEHSAVLPEPPLYAMGQRQIKNSLIVNTPGD